MAPGRRPFQANTSIEEGDALTTITHVPSSQVEGLASADGRTRRALWAARLDRWSDRPLTTLAILLVPMLLAPFLLELSPPEAAALRDGTYGIWGVFAAALVASLVVTPDRRGYLRRHWLNLFVVVIPLFAPLLSARAMQLIWAVGATGRALEGSRRLLVRKGTGFLLLGASLVVAMAAGLIVSVERDDPSATILSYGDGLWWAMTTFATVGYGDKYPVTAAGRGIAVALMLLGIAAFGVVTAKLAALFVEEQEDHAKMHLQQMDDRMRRIETALLRPPGDRSALTMLRRRSRTEPKGRDKVRRRGKRRAARAATATAKLNES